MGLATVSWARARMAAAVEIVDLILEGGGNLGGAEGELQKRPKSKQPSHCALYSTGKPSNANSADQVQPHQTTHEHPGNYSVNVAT